MGPSSPDTQGLDAGALITLSRARLGKGARLFYTPGIPAGQIETARRIHGRSLPVGEAILVLCDTSPTGNAEQGFVITELRLAWKSPWEKPGQALWSAIDRRTIRAEDGRVWIGKSAIEDLDDLAPHAASLLQEIAAQTQPAGHGPYRR
ncbi:MAG: hypothetical protein U0359_23600 [Byssovorax sp.]